MARTIYKTDLVPGPAKLASDEAPKRIDPRKEFARLHVTPNGEQVLRFVGFDDTGELRLLVTHVETPMGRVTYTKQFARDAVPSIYEELSQFDQREAFRFYLHALNDALHNADLGGVQ